VSIAPLRLKRIERDLPPRALGGSGDSIAWRRPGSSRRGNRACLPLACAGVLRHLPGH